MSSDLTSLRARIKNLVGARPFGATVFGGSLVEQVVQVEALPGHHQANVSFDQMRTLSGGSGGNTAVYLSRLGVRVRLADKWGDDEHGELLKDSLEQEGVDISSCKRLHDVRTGFMIILTLPNHDWTGIINLPGELSLFPEDVEEDLIESCAALHFHGFCLQTPAAQAGVQKAIEIARRSGTMLTMDASTPIAEHDPQVLRHYFAACDLVFMNRAEIKFITCKDDLREAIEEVRQLGPELVVVKAGVEGIYYATKDGIEHIPAYSVSVVDTVGAGDGVVAGTLTGLIRGLSLQAAIHLGAATAALVCGGIGGQSHRFDYTDALALANLS